MCFKRIAAVLVLGALFCAGLFAQAPFNGDEFNTQIKKYMDNISRLIPDSVTTQNIWSLPPSSRRGMWGLGLNGSITLANKSKVGGLGSSAIAFDGKQESIPFLPAFAVDLRGGWKYFDIGLTGMWVDTDMIEGLSSIVGEGSYYAHRTLGFDARLALLSDGINSFFGLKVPGNFIPALTFQMGYYFTWMSLGFQGNEDTNYINMDFRNDAYFFALQVSKRFIGLLTPFVGLKLIISSTVTEYSWATDRIVQLKGREYLEGVQYNSGTDTRDTYSYLHLYGGLGVYIMGLMDLTLGMSVNLISGHFTATLALRVVF